MNLIMLQDFWLGLFGASFESLSEATLACEDNWLNSFDIWTLHPVTWIKCTIAFMNRALMTTTTTIMWNNIYTFVTTCSTYPLARKDVAFWRETSHEGFRIFATWSSARGTILSSFCKIASLAIGKNEPDNMHDKIDPQSHRIALGIG